METVGQESPALKKTPYRERSLTVMVIGGLGSVRSFKVSRWILLFASLFLVSFVTFSIVAINRYLELREVNRNLLDSMGRLEEELNKNKRSLQKSRQQTTFLEEYIVNIEERPEVLSRAAKETIPQAKRAEPTGKTASSKETVAGAKTKPLTELLQIEDLLIEKEGAKLSVNFRLTNIQPSNTPVGGYLHVIAEDNKSNPSRWWAYPQQKLVNGFPDNFRNGYLFSVSRYKLIHGRIQLGSGSASPATLKVLLYDQQGTLAIERHFEVPPGS